MTKFMGAAAAAAALALVLATAAASEQHRSWRVLAEFQRSHPCPATGKTMGRCPGWIKDHIIPLCAGGGDVVENLAWQTVQEAKIKDRLERDACRHARSRCR